MDNAAAAAPPEALGGLTAALTLHLPLIMAAFWSLLAGLVAATFQARALRSQMRRSGRWAVAWFVGIVLGVGVARFAGGGLDGASAGSVHPVLKNAVDYWWRMIPRSVFGALIFALCTASAVPLDRPIPSGPD